MMKINKFGDNYSIILCCVAFVLHMQFDIIISRNLELLRTSARKQGGMVFQICYVSINDLRNKSWKPECVGSFNMGWRKLVFYPEPEARDKIY
jgi:hypothetical protein